MLRSTILPSKEKDNMVNIQRLAHASVLIRGENKTIYVDPYRPEDLSEEVKGLYEEPERADILLITHEHQDHCDPSAFKNMLKTTTEIIAPKGCSEKIDKKFHIVEPEDNIKIKDVEIRTTHSYNEKRKRDSGEPFHPKGEGVGYIITIDEKTIYHPGDTENVLELRELDEDIDLAFLPIDGTYTMDVDEAVDLAKFFQPDQVVPFHERDKDLEEFKNKIEKKDITKASILEEGERLEL